MASRNALRNIVLADLSRNFTTSDGIKYGADFVVYRGDMDAEHGFSLIFIKEENTPLSDKDKTLICRICESVKKKGIIAYVNGHTKEIKYVEIFRKTEGSHG
ncbi:tRNA intron endonuclease, putative [Plasmodium knowlesi strain H]|uniref:tRNA-intron lyase n=3 Tax=Plasmodium knowlesi TaxID=5850 RepID=A0A5K1V3H0_PLAKH|nr:tRNA intron endonuclease, putative [Plasmodium knowlesi strain H]OTN65424.1 putative tRNA intron endonuclease [Plasmodium knowlesi]CAA9989608.1 tRNA intron endonuclease, putative [Plasmodium knowlesi strain H]SBO22680.1 tRNA intron endonuclease, putative [Plasmodium knowlesi strain H]SBO23292.1 tRNA intron endonuclease, putative [Plasmodium knowlesi strain H]VVS79082.1 tRNA intron endonuclease, putative [Plasmodium knowlesi strain H]|eukprot:XP_002260334.1 tRNA intron endonuclease, putative [Plasmodium knowlesi strain H]